MSLPRHICDWPAEWRYRYEERAGIMEFDGGMERADAEIEAALAVRREYMIERQRFSTYLQGKGGATPRPVVYSEYSGFTEGK